MRGRGRADDINKILEDILIECAIIPSAQRGLLGDTNSLTVAGDGSALPTGANPNGKPSCKCRENGIYNCEHDRYYSDPSADWGYDSYRDCYYFGHTLYQHVVSTNGHDLPMNVSISNASETDFTLSMKSMDRLTKALNPRSGIYPSPNGTAEVIDENGIPICPGGMKMRRHFYDKKKGRIYYTCPIKRPTHSNGKYCMKTHTSECPRGVLCQPNTKMGPVVYVRTKDDPRLYPPIPRGSDKFKRLMKFRSGCERSNSAKKETYRLGERPCRSAVHFLVRLYLVSIIEHAKAWLAEAKKKLDTDDPVVIAQALVA